MATKSTNKRTTKSTTVKTKKPAVEIMDESVEEVYTSKDIDLHQYVTVKNGFQGTLVYQSKKTGERFLWDGFGAEQEIELIELRNAKSNSKKYFVNNWFMFDEDWVIDYLGVKQYYKNAIKIDDFDNIFKLPLDKMTATISALSDGQKKSVAYRARTLIDSGEIDSMKAISTLEEILGIELIER